MCIRDRSYGNIVINGGTIRAFGGFQAAGIGGSGASGGSVGKILIEETNDEKINIYAEGGESSGAGIGSGYGSGDVYKRQLLHNPEHHFPC